MRFFYFLRAEIMKLLINHGLDPNDLHRDGYSPIHRVAWGKEKRHTDTMKVLLSSPKVNCNMKSGDGKTALDMCSNKGTINIFKKLCNLKERGGSGGSYSDSANEDL